MKFEVGTFTAPGATGNQTISLVDTGFGTVKAIKIWGTYQNAEGDVGADLIFCHGLGTYRGASPQQWCMTHFADDAAGTSACAKGMTSSSILRGYSAAAPTVDFDAALASLGNAQCVINWIDLPATASIKFNYLAIGGDDVTDALVATGDVTTATGNQDFTVVTGFGKPDLLCTISGATNTTEGDAAASVSITFGVGKDDTNERGVGFMDQNNAATMNLASVASADLLRPIANPSALGFDASLAARVDWPTDGFRLTKAAAPQATMRFGYLALRGTFTAVIGAATVPTVTGNQDLAVGNTPRGAIFFHNAIPTAAGLDNTHADLGMFGFGAMDGTREVHSAVGDNDAAASAETHRHHSETKAIRIFTPSATGTLVADADASFSGNNVRLTWTTVDTAQREFSYLLLGDGTSEHVKAGAGIIGP